MLLPIIMICVCALLGGGTLIFLKLSAKHKKSKNKDKEELAQITANEFVNVKDIRGNFLYTRDNLALAYLKIYPISTELFSKNEKRLIAKQLTVSLSSAQYPFQLLAVSRPVDISPLLSELSATLTSSSDVKQKELLKQEIVEMGAFALSGEVVERQFYIKIWDRVRNFEAYYARLNLKRNKGRTAITVLSLIMSITVFIALQGFTTILNAASALQESHLGDYQITNETVGFSADALRELQENESVQSVAAIQFSLYEQNEAGKPDGIDIGFALKPGETFQVIGLNDEYWDYFMGSELSADQLEELKSGNACVVRNPISVSYGEEPLEFTSIEAGSTICVAGTDLAVLETLDGYEGYLGIGNGGFTNGVQVIVDDSIYEQLTGKNTYSEFLPTLNKDVDRETFDTFVEDFCKQTPGTTFLSYEETDQQLQESFAQIQMLAWGLILFVGLIGILNIINTVYTNIHTRVTEIGMQRAIGMSASSLYKTFLWEGAYYGITASVIGSILGYICTIFIEAATSDTIQLVAIPVVSILEATLLAVGACLLATAIPLRKISNMSIVDSIETIE